MPTARGNYVCKHDTRLTVHSGNLTLWFKNYLYFLPEVQLFES